MTYDDWKTTPPDDLYDEDSLAAREQAIDKADADYDRWRDEQMFDHWCEDHDIDEFERTDRNE